MNILIKVLTSLALTAIPLTSHAASITKDFSWIGDGGFSASGSFTYDDTVAMIFADGTGIQNGLEELSVSFFDPSDTLLQSSVIVTGGVSSSSGLRFQFDTATMSFVSESIFVLSATDGSLSLSANINRTGLLLDSVGEGIVQIVVVDRQDPFTIVVSDPIAPVPLPAGGLLLLGGLGALQLMRRPGKPASDQAPQHSG